MSAESVQSQRIQVLRRILESGGARTQEGLREALVAENFSVNQSTISRDLRKLGAVRVTTQDGRLAYQLVGKKILPPLTEDSVLVTDVRVNENLIVVLTPPGTASLVARKMDGMGSQDVIGTLAGDDTVLVIPKSTKSILRIAQDIRRYFGVADLAGTWST